MPRFAGIVHPHHFHFSPKINPMLDVALRYNREKDILQKSTVEMGIVDGRIGTTPKNRFFCVFDGSISNRNYFLSSLRDRGFSHFSATDSELIAAIADFGLVDLLDELEGEFAFALWDSLKNEFFLYRDFIGKKPLYWFRSAHYFLFGSDLKSLIASLVVPQTVSLEGLANYLSLGFLPQDVTLIAGINKLLPGYKLHFSDRQILKISNYRSFSSLFSTEKIKGDFGDIAAFFYEQLEDVVAKEVKKSNSPFGLFISGGLGSASIAKICSEKKGIPFYGFSSFFSGKNEEDFLIAAELSRDFKIPLEGSKITPSLIESFLPRVTWEMDMPLADPYIFMGWEMCRAASHAGIHTVFSGMGSDELLIGHQKYLSVNQLPELVFSNFLDGLRKKFYQYLVRLTFPFYTGSIRWLKNIYSESFLNLYIDVHKMVSASQLESLNPFLDGLFDSEIFIRKFHNLNKVPNFSQKLAYIDIKTRLPDLYIQQIDRASDYYNLNWKTPYLYDSLIKLSAQLPLDFLESHPQENYLKKMLTGSLPNHILNRPKVYRGKFLSSWASYFRPHFMSLLDGALVQTGLIRPQPLSNWLQNDLQMEEYFNELYTLLTLEVWFRLFIAHPMDKERAEIPLEVLLREK